MPKKDKDESTEDERFAAREFKSVKAAKPRRTTPTPTERAEARAHAQAAAAIIPEVAIDPKFTISDVPADTRFPEAPIEQRLLDPEEKVPVAEAKCCRCGVEMGEAVRGVFTGGDWYCPRDFMTIRDRSLHPVARAVECPTCHRVAVDFGGRNRCPVCGSRAAQPLRRAG